MEYEESLLRVPLESLQKGTRIEAKRLEKEWDVVMKALSTLSDREEKGEGQGVDAVCRSMEKIQGKLRGVKRKMQDGLGEQDATLAMCHRRARLTGEAAEKPGDIDGSRAFLMRTTHRLVAEHLLHSGFLRTAETLAEEAGIAEYLVSLQVARSLKPLSDALLNGDTQPALAWCNENRGKLQLRSSSVEMHLRILDCVQLADDSDSILPAVEYCKQHVTPLVGSGEGSAERMKLVERLLGHLVFGKANPDHFKERYACVARGDMRQQLALEFSEEYLGASCVSEVPLLLLLLQAGVLCLNTAGGVTRGAETNPADPMSDPSMQALAYALPALTRKNSALICPLTGRVMDDNNPPIVTPAGHLYSQAAVSDIIGRSGTSEFRCPKTGVSYPPSFLQKLYVM